MRTIGAVLIGLLFFVGCAGGKHDPIEFPWTLREGEIELKTPRGVRIVGRAEILKDPVMADALREIDLAHEVYSWFIFADPSRIRPRLIRFVRHDDWNTRYLGYGSRVIEATLHHDHPRALGYEEALGDMAREVVAGRREQDHLVAERWTRIVLYGIYGRRPPP